MVVNFLGSPMGADLHSYLTQIHSNSQAVQAIPHIIKRKEQDSMAKKKKEQPSLWERSEYEVISETETETELIAVLKTKYSGATVICHIPKHTKEEEEKIAADVTYALMQIAFTGQDISQMKHMEILMD